MGWRCVWALIGALAASAPGAVWAETAVPAAAPAVPATAGTDAKPPVPVPSPAVSGDADQIPPTTLAKAAAALENALTLLRHGQTGLATLWDRNAWVQCRHWGEHEILCEGAGNAMQPSLSHVLTLDRAMHLAELAWTVDPRFGNYVHVSSATIGARLLAREMLLALRDGYGADLGQVEVRSAWVRDAKCPPRNGPRQNLAGSIDDAPAMAATAVRSCFYAPAMTGQARSTADLFGLYGLRVAGEVQRLIVNNDASGIHLVLNGKPGYVQCAPDRAPPGVYCEAASADSMPALAKVLTPDRVQRLHALGFADPGQAPNYARSIPLAQANALRLTGDLLTILYEVYGYKGQPLMGISTEKGR